MPRRITKTSKEIGNIHIDQAARPQKPPVGGDDFHRDHLLSRPRPVRVAVLPEPVDVSSINGRAPAVWEEGQIEAARLRERRAELAMFTGLIG